MLKGVKVSTRIEGLCSDRSLEEQIAQSMEELGRELASGKSSKLLAYLEFLARFHQYSFGNSLAILVQRPTATLVAGHARWRELGRTFIRGARPIRIHAPILKKVLMVDCQTDQDAEDEILIGVKEVSVFDVADTEGKPLPAFEQTRGEATELLAALEVVVETAGLHLIYELLLYGRNGWTDGKSIGIHSQLACADKFRCLLHELSHCQLLHLESRRGTSRQIAETEAEATAFVVCQAFGIETRDRSRDYIQLWNGSAEILMQSLKFVQVAATGIISALQAALKQSSVE